MLHTFDNCHTGAWTQVIVESDHSVVKLRFWISVKFYVLFLGTTGIHPKPLSKKRASAQNTSNKATSRSTEWGNSSFLSPRECCSSHLTYRNWIWADFVEAKCRTHTSISHHCFCNIWESSAWLFWELDQERRGQMSSFFLQGRCREG